jgi:hypothetical protein
MHIEQRQRHSKSARHTRQRRNDCGGSHAVDRASNPETNPTKYRREDAKQGGFPHTQSTRTPAANRDGQTALRIWFLNAQRSANQKTPPARIFFCVFERPTQIDPKMLRARAPGRAAPPLVIERLALCHCAQARRRSLTSETALGDPPKFTRIHHFWRSSQLRGCS